MGDPKNIDIRPIKPSDFDVLVKLHSELLPISYETDFFRNVVNKNGIMSWGAVDRSRPNGHDDKLVGFITARIVPVKESEIEDLLTVDPSNSDQRCVVYILTIGVAKSYRNQGIAYKLLDTVITYATHILNCEAVYLHVVSNNNPAIRLYKKMHFRYGRKVRAFYFIDNQHYDAYIFIRYLKGGRNLNSTRRLLRQFREMGLGFKLALERMKTNGLPPTNNIKQEDSHNCC